MVYDKIKDIGYAEAEAVYKPQLEKLTSDLEKKKLELEVLSAAYEDTREDNIRIFKSEMSAYVQDIKRANKPMYIVKDGKCTITPEFVQAYNGIITKANSRLSDSTK